MALEWEGAGSTRHMLILCAARSWAPARRRVSLCVQVRMRARPQRCRRTGRGERIDYIAAYVSLSGGAPRTHQGSAARYRRTPHGASAPRHRRRLASLHARPPSRPLLPPDRRTRHLSPTTLWPRPNANLTVSLIVSRTCGALRFLSAFSLRCVRRPGWAERCVESRHVRARRVRLPQRRAPV